MMPALSGFELLEMVEDGALDLDDVPVFVVSAFNVALASPDAHGGVERCFGKSFDPDALAVRERLAEPATCTS